MNVAGGSTDVTTYFVLRLAADGTEATGLTITNFDLQYVRTGEAPAAKVDATALAATDSAHADNKAIEIDGTDQPGLYRVDWPDAAFAAGVKQVILSVKCATAFTEHLAVDIDAPVHVTSMAAGTVTASAVATGAIDADALAANAITAAKLDPDVTTELQNGLATAAAVADLPTNAELATALGTADDAVLAAIAALNDFDPSSEEVLANVKKVNDVTIVGDGSGTPFNV